MEKLAYSIFGPKGCIEQATKRIIGLAIIGGVAYVGINALIKSINAQTISESPPIVSPSPTVLEKTLKPTLIPQSKDCTTKQSDQTTWDAATSLGDPNTISDYSVYTIEYPDKQQLFTLDLDNWSTSDTGRNETGVRQAPTGSIICGKK